MSGQYVNFFLSAATQATATATQASGQSNELPCNKFLEIKSDTPDISLNHYYLVVLEFYSPRHIAGSERQLNLKGAISLQGKRLKGHIGFIGESSTYIMHTIFGL